MKPQFLFNPDPDTYGPVSFQGYEWWPQDNNELLEAGERLLIAFQSNQLLLTTVINARHIQNRNGGVIIREITVTYTNKIFKTAVIESYATTNRVWQFTPIQHDNTAKQPGACMIYRKASGALKNVPGV